MGVVLVSASTSFYCSSWLLYITLANSYSWARYHIAGNFRGSVGKEHFAEKTLRNVKTGRIMGVACLEFCGENFRGWRKNHEIRESFLPRKFPTIRYL